MVGRLPSVQCIERSFMIMHGALILVGEVETKASPVKHIITRLLAALYGVNSRLFNSTIGICVLRYNEISTVRRIFCIMQYIYYYFIADVMVKGRALNTELQILTRNMCLP